MQVILSTDRSSQYERLQRILGLTDVGFDLIPKISKEDIWTLQPGDLLVYLGALVPGGMQDLIWGGHRIWQLPRGPVLNTDQLSDSVRRRFYAELCSTDWFCIDHVRIEKIKWLQDLGLALMPSDPRKGSALVRMAAGMNRVGFSERKPLKEALQMLPVNIAHLCTHWGTSIRHLRKQTTQMAPTPSESWADRMVCTLVHERNGISLERKVKAPTSRVSRPGWSECGGLPSWLRPPQESDFH